MTAPAFLDALPAQWRKAVTCAFGLVVFTLVFTALMAFTHEMTRERIDAAKAAQQMRLIDEVLPRASYDNKLLEDVVNAGGNSAHVGRIWRARRGGEAVALVFETYADDGYGGRIDLVVGLGADGCLGGVRVAAHHETPGLGDYIDPAKDRDKKSPWVAQFIGVAANLPAERWAVEKDGGDFAYHAGATVSPRAVLRAVGRGANWTNAHLGAIFAAPTGAKIAENGQAE
ncbi:MAG: RnfABCDGE type electron transport complex subunit G [Azoarcus sp.]|jgi:electron transport complex protein RnfG|nr:RnfABCDGE type electron transport complex subunit G [Azoarcus sp.]